MRKAKTMRPLPPALRPLRCSTITLIAIGPVEREARPIRRRRVVPLARCPLSYET